MRYFGSTNPSWCKDRDDCPPHPLDTKYPVLDYTSEHFFDQYEVFTKYYCDDDYPFDNDPEASLIPPESNATSMCDYLMATPGFIEWEEAFAKACHTPGAGGMLEARYSEHFPGIFVDPNTGLCVCPNAQGGDCDAPVVLVRKKAEALSEKLHTEAWDKSEKKRLSTPYQPPVKIIAPHKWYDVKNWTWKEWTLAGMGAVGVTLTAVIVFGD